MSIIQKENPILREIAKEVPLEEITTPKIQKILKEMIDALHKEDVGVALAAPQISYGLRIFVVCSVLLEKPKIGAVEGSNKEIRRRRKEKHKDLIFINPKIIKISKKKELVPEGCLSIQWLFGNVKRSTKATIQAYDERGKKFTRGASGLLAQIFQHEIDHLNGILFTDKAQDVEGIGLENTESGSL